MTREEFYKLTDILSTDVLGNFMHGGEADELIAMFEEVVEHSNILEQEESVSEELEEAIEDAMPDANWYIEENNDTTGEDAYNSIQMGNMFKAGAKWQKSHLWKPADGDDLPILDREVIALLDNGKVVFAHRPPEYWDGKDIVTGKVTRHYPKTYDKGGWNIPNVKYWLDCLMPKEIEL